MCTHCADGFQFRLYGKYRKEGRTTIANIERVSALYLTKTIYSVLLCTIFIIIGKSYPFIPIQLSLIGATAIGIPSFFLALENTKSRQQPDSYAMSCVFRFLPHSFCVSEFAPSSFCPFVLVLQQHFIRR